MLITRIDFAANCIGTSSSEDELDSESEEDTISTSVVGEEIGFSSTWVVMSTVDFENTDVRICTRRRSSSVIGGESKSGSGRGCLAPRACDVRGRHPVLTSVRMSLWRKRLGQTSSRE